MKSLIDSYTNSKNLHHAYMLEGEKTAIREKLLAFIGDTLEHPTQGNPDFWHEQFETFSIDDARKLRDMQSMKPLVHERKIFIAEVLSMTVEAQNALLKIFEEPTPNTHFFIIVDSADTFLPTLRSRMQVIVDDSVAIDGAISIKEFMKASKAERLALILPYIEEKDKGEAMKLVDGLIQYMYNNEKREEKNASLMHELLQARSYLSDRSPSLKLILEHISLILPTI
jgi:DNA polymerase III delta prime subunit